jgi:hypothetical protein
MSQEANDLTAHNVLIAACLKHRVPFFWRSPGTLLISGKGIRTVLEQSGERWTHDFRIGGIRA